MAYLQRTINVHQKTLPYAVTADADFAADFPVNETVVELNKTTDVDSVVALPTEGGSTIQVITFILATKTGTGNYTIDCFGGTVTFDAVGDSATFAYSSETVGWFLVCAQGATLA